MQSSTHRFSEGVAEAQIVHGLQTSPRQHRPAWDAPTLRELAERVQHQFGSLSSLSGLETLGLGRDEPLSPGDVHLVCDLLGVPAADFGLDV